MDQQTIDLFWSKVDIRGENECWTMRRSRYSGSYGTVIIDGKSFRAHRLAWEITNGAIPPGMFVCHSCDNPPCCNPNHLWVGTQTDNMQDMIKKGRGPKKRDATKRTVDRSPWTIEIVYGADGAQYELMTYVGNGGNYKCQP